jgi:Immunity protein 10
MIVHFETDSVFIEETDLDVLIVGFYKEDNYLMIQQSLDEYDEQDIRLGMNTYHIERDDQSFGGYGGVEKINLSRNAIEVKLDKTGRENLQCDGVEIDFETDDENYEILTEKLKYIFSDLLVVN